MNRRQSGTMVPLSEVTVIDIVVGQNLVRGMAVHVPSDGVGTGLSLLSPRLIHEESDCHGDLTSSQVIRWAL